MHAASFLSRWLDISTVVRHRARVQSLARAVQALLDGKKLALTHLGRHRAGPAHVKHHIKAMDRLLGNSHLHDERDGLYRAMARSLLVGQRNPVILVDWSDFELERQWLMLKAAVPVEGRAITIYEQVFPFRCYNSPGAHRQFLERLKSILPDSCVPTVITDAGFRGPWFRAVEALGWNWIGRIRNSIKYFNEATGRWCLTKSLYPKATTKVRHIGWVTLSKRKKYGFRLYLVRAYRVRRGRPVKRVYRKQSNLPMYHKMHKDPWLLATNLPHSRLMPRQVKRLYAQRMQIEETFRDVKGHQWGMGLRYARCNSAKRLEVLLLIAALATLVLWMSGLHARLEGVGRQFQANTLRSRAVLSLVFLGQQFLQRLRSPIPIDALDRAFFMLQILMRKAAMT